MQPHWSDNPEASGGALEHDISSTRYSCDCEAWTWSQEFPGEPSSRIQTWSAVTDDDEHVKHNRPTEPNPKHTRDLLFNISEVSDFNISESLAYLRCFSWDQDFRNLLIWLIYTPQNNGIQDTKYVYPKKKMLRNDNLHE